MHAFAACGAAYEPQTQVWQIEPGWSVFLKRDGQTERVRAGYVVLATGAQERPAPFPGWTLPGVLTVGAAQIMLKTSRQVPSDPVWIVEAVPCRSCIWRSYYGQADRLLVGWIRRREVNGALHCHGPERRFWGGPRLSKDLRGRTKSDVQMFSECEV